MAARVTARGQGISTGLDLFHETRDSIDVVRSESSGDVDRKGVGGRHCEVRLALGEVLGYGLEQGEQGGSKKIR